MPFYMTAGKVYELRILHSMRGQALVNILHVKLFDPDGVTPFSGQLDSGVFLVDMKDAFRDEYQAIISDQVFGEKIEVWQVSGVSLGTPTANGTPRYKLEYNMSDESFYSTLDQGQKPDPPLPTFCSVTIKKRGNLPGATIRGSNRWSGVTEPQTGDPEVNGNALSDEARTLWSGLAGLIENGTTSGSGAAKVAFGILSRKAAFLDPMQDVNNGFARCETVSVDKWLGSQVSRKVVNGLR